MRDICELSERIAQEFKPERIILFGSHARGDPREDSDVDLLVILPFEGHAAYQAARIRRRVRPRFPLDLVVRTPEEMRWRLRENDWFLREIVDQGEVLYEAADRRVG